MKTKKSPLPLINGIWIFRSESEALFPKSHTQKNFTFKLFWLKLLQPLMLGWKSLECSSITKFKQTLKIYPNRIVSALRSFFHPPRLTVHRVCISVITVVSTVTKTIGWILPDKNTVKKCNSLYDKYLPVSLLLFFYLQSITFKIFFRASHFWLQQFSYKLNDKKKTTAIASIDLFIKVRNFEIFLYVV